ARPGPPRSGSRCVPSIRRWVSGAGTYQNALRVRAIAEVDRMPEKQHWPFGGDGTDGGRVEHERELERLRRDDTVADARKHLRLNRFIVGGRGHVKKRGLS
ncbi:MAG TPA: hypothetical protein VF902_01160, partial [Coriobacteriia bacterium]